MTDPNPIALLMLCIHLYQRLPQYLPKASVQFTGGLHCTVSRQVQYCYALPVSRMSCSLASICIDDPRTLTSVCDCGSRGHTVS